MASIFHQQYTTEDPKTGKKTTIKSKHWYIDYRTADGTRARIKAFKDKAATIQLAAKLERDAERTEAGLIDKFQEHRKKPLAEHLVDFKEVLLCQGATPRHAVGQYNRAVRIFDLCDFVFFQDIIASKLQAAINKLKCQVRRTENGKLQLVDTQRDASAMTKHYYLQACKQFLRWAVQDQRIAESPIAHVKLRTGASATRPALEEDEIRWLIAVTKTSEKRCGIAGANRALLYRFAAETGLRASEIRALRVSDFDLAQKTVSLDGRYAKNRKCALVHLRSDTVTILENVFQSKAPQDQAFKMPHPCTVVRMFRKDLAAARERWLEEVRNDPKKLSQRMESHFLDCDKDEGTVDFHSLRHAFGTMLFKYGVHPKMAQALLRHGDINLTMNRYTHTWNSAEAEAIERLPDLSKLPIMDD